MKFTKMLGAAAVAAIGLLVFASTASATTLAINGTAMTGITLVSTLRSGTAQIWKDTNNLSRNTCTSSEISGTEEEGHGTGTTVTVPVATERFAKCSRPVVVDSMGPAGTLHIDRIGTTANGAVSSSATKVTVGSAIGPLNCENGTGTHLGVLTGAAAGSHATMVINATLNCGIIPSAKWEAEYTVTSPTGLSVVG